MRIGMALLVGFVLAHLGPAPNGTALPQAGAAERECGGAGRAYVRTTLYLGLSRGAGTISDAEWQAFLADEVTSRFPGGLTVWEADGQWRRPDATIGRERAKVLLLVHDGKAKAHRSITELVNRYKQKFEQESVLWESAAVCAAF